MILPRHPRPDISGAIAKDNTASGFVLSQETDSLTIGKDQVRKVQNGDTTRRLGVDELGQFVHTLGSESTADREYRPSAARAMNP
jgi:hypothetical protein